MYLVEGKAKLTHQVDIDAVPSYSTLLPPSLPDRIYSLLFTAEIPLVWVVTILDAVNGRREVLFPRGLKHGIEQLPNCALRLRETTTPAEFFIRKEQFSRDLFSTSSMPPTLLAFSTLGDRGDWYAGFDAVSRNVIFSAYHYDG
jgi:hypothetical protein